jgi:hypothetical protein
MPKEIYLKVKKQCFDILRNLFEVVDSPIDGPDKTDYGDIDILLFEPKFTATNKGALEVSLGSVKSIVETKDELAAHFAIPWPAEDSLHTTPPTEPSSEDVQEGPKDRHIQVDISVCTDLHRLRWTLFKHAHGDIWNMIGATIRPYGLTVDEEALWLRVPEIEKLNKKRAKVFLTSDPDAILRFVDLSPHEYWERPFQDFHAMAEYVAQCRMFWVPPLPAEDDEGMVADVGGSGPSDDRRKLKSNDRRRMNTRPGFRRWIDEFYPECRRRGVYLQQKTSREEITQEAFDRFDGAKEEFEKRRRDFLLEQQRDVIWNKVIKGTIPPPDDITDLRAVKLRGTLVKAFKRIILEGDDHYGVVAPAELKDEDGFFVTENVIDFVVRTKDDVGRVAYEKQHAAFLEKKAKEGERQTQKTEAQPSSGVASLQTDECLVE